MQRERGLGDGGALRAFAACYLCNYLPPILPTLSWCLFLVPFSFSSSLLIHTHPYITLEHYICICLSNLPNLGTYLARYCICM